MTLHWNIQEGEAEKSPFLLHPKGDIYLWREGSKYFCHMSHIHFGFSVSTQFHHHLHHHLEHHLHNQIITIFITILQLLISLHTSRKMWFVPIARGGRGKWKKFYVPITLVPFRLGIGGGVKWECSNVTFWAIFFWRHPLGSFLLFWSNNSLGYGFSTLWRKRWKKILVILWAISAVILL